MSSAANPVEIFCSYAHEDKPFLDELQKHLSLSQRQGLITTWHDRLIPLGTDWSKSIDTHLETASLILLLISADFFASDYCIGVEMKRALQRHEAGVAHVLPILLRSCTWNSAPFAHLQVLPTGALPVTEWPDQDKAWTAVVTGLLRIIEDIRQRATSTSHTALPTIWTIPYPRNPFFTGRDEVLARIHTQLQAGLATALSQPQAISGLGGIGKTHIAVEYAYRYRQEYQTVLWVRAESQETLTTSYSTVANLLKLPERDAQEQEIIIHAVKNWLQLNRNWLLILDNADELDLLPPFLPTIPAGHFLLTTRAQALRGLAQRVEVETFLPEQGALFLLRRAALLAPDAPLEQASPQNRAQAIEITRELGQLPLALDQVGAYLEETGCPLSEYLLIYQKHRADLLKQRGGLVADHPKPVATTWSLSFARVEQKNPASAELLRLCAFLAPDAIPLEMITQGATYLGAILEPVVTNPFLFNQAIEVLRAHSLVQRDPATNTLSIHRLVQAVVQDTLDEQQRQQWMRRTLLSVDMALPAVEYKNWAQWNRILAQAMTCAELIMQHNSNLQGASHLLHQTGWYLQERARYSEAQPLIERALKLSERHLGPEHLDTARHANKLAELCQIQGKYERAESLFQRALTIREQHLGPQHPYTAATLHSLAALYYAQGQYERAEPLFQRALAIREQHLGSHHPDTAPTLNNLAGLYRRQGKYEQAEPLNQRALAICEQHLGPHHPHTAQSLNNLALLYQLQGKYEQAESLFQRTLAICEQHLELYHPYIAITLNNLAFLYYTQNQYERAEPLYEQALAIWRQRLGPEHPNTRVARNHYASLLKAMGREPESIREETGDGHD